MSQAAELHFAGAMKLRKFDRYSLTLLQYSATNDIKLVYTRTTPCCLLISRDTRHIISKPKLLYSMLSHTVQKLTWVIWNHCDEMTEYSKNIKYQLEKQTASRIFGTRRVRRRPILTIPTSTTKALTLYGSNRRAHTAWLHLAASNRQFWKPTPTVTLLHNYKWQDFVSLPSVRSISVALFLACEDFGRMFDHSSSACTFSCFVFF